MSKRQVDHTIGDILRLQPKWLLQKQSNPAALGDYFTRLHSMLDHGFNHLTSELFFDVFETWDISALTSKDFNKAIMTFKERTKSESLAPVVTKLGVISKPALLKALEQDRSALTNKIRRLRDNKVRYINDAERYESDIRSLIQSAHEARVAAQHYEEDIHTWTKKLEAPAKIEADKIKLLKAIPDSWIVVEAMTDSFTIVRKVPIIVNFTNANTGVAKSLNMGFLGLEMTWELYVKDSFGVADFIDYPEVAIHPHLSGNSICWGNTAHRADEYRKDKEYGKFFQLFEVLMSTYNPDNPYVALNTLERVKNERWSLLGNSFRRKEWWITNRDALVRTWAQTASPKFIEKISEAFTPIRVRVQHDPREKKALDKAIAEAQKQGKLPAGFPIPSEARDGSNLTLPEKNRIFAYFCETHNIDINNRRASRWYIDPNTPPWIRQRFMAVQLIEDATYARRMTAETYLGRFEWQTNDYVYYQQYLELYGVSWVNRTAEVWELPARTPSWVLRRAAEEGLMLRPSGSEYFIEDAPIPVEASSMDVPF